MAKEPYKEVVDKLKELHREIKKANKILEAQLKQAEGRTDPIATAIIEKDTEQ